MHALLNRFFELALSEVHRYEGTINQFLGDGFMALFGAPVAHEDHASRAVLAAVTIQRRVGEARAELAGAPSAELSVRIGLNSFLVAPLATEAEQPVSPRWTCPDLVDSRWASNARGANRRFLLILLMWWTNGIRTRVSALRGLAHRLH